MPRLPASLVLDVLDPDMREIPSTGRGRSVKKTMLNMRGSDAAHALAFIDPEIELAAIGRRRQVRLIERHGRAMQEHLAADATHAGADGTVNLDRVDPGVGIVVAHVPPSGVVMERTVLISTQK